MKLSGWIRAALVLAVAGIIGSTACRGATLAARTLVADQLLDDARQAVRNGRLPLALANRQALVLLQQARALTPDSADIQRSLAEVAREAHQPDLELDALKNVVRLEPDNLVAQVAFLDLLAGRRQTVEQKIAVFQSALDAPGLERQVRSAMALRIYRLLLQRGQNDEANGMLSKALDLNDVNVAAWHEMAQQLADMPGRTADYFQALVNALLANPYQPAVLLEGGHLLAAHNEHDQAVDWLSAGVEQMQMTGQPAPVEEFQILATEMAAAGRQAELSLLVQSLLAQEKPALPVLLLAYTLHAPQGVVPGTAEDPLVARIGKALAVPVTADARNAAALVDALWFDLFYVPAVPEDVTARLRTLENLVTPADGAYQRLRGWQLLRAGNLKAARDLLAPLAKQDVYAALGLVRIAERENNSKEVATRLQDLYAAHPAGLLAVHILNEARKQNVTLEPTALSQSLHAIAVRYPHGDLTVQRQPRDIELIEAAVGRRRFKFGEPITVDIKITNTSDRALAVGPQGAIKVGVAVGGTLRGLGAQELGLFAMDNSPRVFRLERHSSLVEHVRVDQGVLRDVLLHSPMQMLSVALTLLSEPRGTADRITIGLGGQALATINFEREGFLEGSAEALTKLLGDLPTLPLDQRLLDTGALAAVAATIRDEAAPAISTPSTAGQITPAQLKRSIVEALLQRAQSDEPLELAWLLRLTPFKDAPVSLKDLLDKAVDSPVPLVRILACGRMAAVGALDPDQKDNTVAALRKIGSMQSDPVVKEWVATLVAQLTLPPPETPAAPARPATAPATLPAEVPATNPASVPATLPTTMPHATRAPADSAAPATRPLGSVEPSIRVPAGGAKQ